MLSQSLVYELSPYSIRINTLAPGATLTQRTYSEEPGYERHWENVIPIGKVAKPAEIAAAALFFLSDAANHITGQTLVVDGGWTSTGQLPELIDLNKSKSNSESII